MKVQNKLTPSVRKYRLKQQMANNYSMPKIKKADLITSLKNMQIIHDENGVNKLMPRVRYGYNSLKTLAQNNKNLLIGATALTTATAIGGTTVSKKDEIGKTTTSIINPKSLSLTKLGTAHAKPTTAPKTWKKYAEEHGGTYKGSEVSGVVVNDNMIEEQRQKHETRQNDLNFAYRYPEGKHPDATKLGTAHAQPTTAPKTWKKYAEEHGGTYKGLEISGVVVNDILAQTQIKRTTRPIEEVKQEPIKEEIKEDEKFIKGNIEQKTNIKEEIKSLWSKFNEKFKDITSYVQNHVKAFLLGATALLLSLIGYKSCNNSSNEVPYKMPNEIVAAPVDTTTHIAKSDTVVLDTTKLDVKKPDTSVTTPKVDEVKTKVIKKGDNVWNIAKQHLKEINGKKPTNKEVLAETKRLMELNNYHFEKDEKTVLIYPKDTIKL